MQWNIIRTNRRVALAVSAISAVALCVSGCSGAGATASDKKVEVLKTSITPVMSLAGLYAGIKGGDFTTEGVNITPVSLTGAGAAMVPALQAGSIDIAASNVVTVIAANAAGKDVQCFAGITQKPESGRNLALLTSPRKTINKASDLEGANIAVNALGGGNELIARAWLQDEGVDPNGVKFVAVPFPQMAQVLASGDAAAAIVDEPFTTMAVNDGAKVLDPHPYSVLAPAPYFDCWAASSETIKNRGQALRAFVAALDKVNEKLNSDPKFLQDTLVADIKIAADVAPDVVAPIYSTKIAASDLDVWITSGKKFGVLTGDVDPANVVAAP